MSQGRGQEYEHCPKERKNNPLRRPLVLIIKKSSVVRDEKHSSPDFSELVGVRE